MAGVRDRNDCVPAWGRNQRERRRTSRRPDRRLNPPPHWSWTANNGEVIFERDAGVVTPIASITKLMTALVVLDGQQPLDEVIKITADDHWKGKGAFSHLPIGAKLTRGDLLRLALMASENLAARTLGAQLSRAACPRSSAR